MARYTGPKSKIARKFREPIFGPDKALEKELPSRATRKHKNVQNNLNTLFS